VLEEDGSEEKTCAIKMTPPPQSLCFVMLVTTICFVLAVAQTTDLEEPSADGVYTDAALETGT
jgi:hypothetical protein